MLSASERLEYFTATLERMPLARNLGFTVREVQSNLVVLEMPIVADQHANLLGVVHGGVLMSLADTAMGSACANLGSLPTTIDMNINFLKSIKAAGSVWAVANVLHHGSHTMVAEAELYGPGKELAAKARGTFFIMGELDELKSREKMEE